MNAILNYTKLNFSLNALKCVKFYGAVAFTALCLLSASAVQAQQDVDLDFLNESDFRSRTVVDPNDEEVILPDMLELKKTQAESTQEFNFMLQAIMADLDNVEDIVYEKPVMKSLFFNLTEYALIQEARSGFEARLPGSGISAAQSTAREIRARRDLVLGGIIYNNKKSWSIYLNELRITPDTLPDEILDIQVHSDFIRLKWFDKGTNTIFPVKLRPNQRFNLDARLFFPG